MAKTSGSAAPKKRRSPKKSTTTPTGISYGVFNYDVPKNARSSYSKVSKLMHRVSVMQSWSCYLIPWGLMEGVRETIEAINEKLISDGKTPITFSIIPFDASANDVCLAEAERGLHRIISDTKRTLMDNLKKVREAFEKDEDTITFKKGFKSERRKALKKLADAEQCATVFLLTDNLCAAFVTLNKIIEAASELPEALRDKPKDTPAETEAIAEA